MSVNTRLTSTSLVIRMFYLANAISFYIVLEDCVAAATPPPPFYANNPLMLRQPTVDLQRM